MLIYRNYAKLVQREKTNNEHTLATKRSFRQRLKCFNDERSMSKAKRVLEARKNKHTAGYFVFNMLVHQRQKVQICHEDIALPCYFETAFS